MISVLEIAVEGLKSLGQLAEKIAVGAVGLALIGVGISADDIQPEDFDVGALDSGE